MPESLALLKQECLNCTKCGLCEYRTNLVFGSGDENASVMFVGEAPGEREDALGVPFVGRAGRMLDELLKEIGLDRQKIYIANMCKCRPPENRDPSKSEQDACIGYLFEQIDIINPSLIVCLGRISAKRLISSDFMVTKQHGEVFEKNGYKIMGTFHPAAILRNINQKPLAIEDFMKIKEYADK